MINVTMLSPSSNDYGMFAEVTDQDVMVRMEFCVFMGNHEHDACNL